MSESAVRTALYNVVNGVSNKGVCYDRCRLSTTWDVFLTLFKTTVSGTDQIRGWWIELRGMPREELDFDPFGAGHTIRSYNFRVFGVLGLDDSASTEKTFAALTEAVANAIDADSTLHNTGTYYDCPACSVDVFEPRVFAGTLCHYTEINVSVKEIV